MKRTSVFVVMVLLICLVFFTNDDIAKAADFSEDKLELDNEKIFLRYDPGLEEYRDMFYDYFHSGYWENRSNGVCLTLHPKLWAWSELDKYNAWMSVYATYYRSNYWDNTEIMRQQFYCHARFIYQLIERDWNLEPWKTSIDPINCN